MPEPRFIAEAFPYPVRRLAVEGGELAYVEVGEGRPVLLVHGNPTWSFLYRKVIAALTGSGTQLVAPDLLGFGRSSKPWRVEAHSLRLHGEALRGLVEALDLKGLILVGQDWGGPIATWVGAAVPERVSGVLLMNTSVLSPKGFRATSFHRFARMPVVSELAFRVAGFPLQTLGRVQADPKSISGEVAKAYRWPLRRLIDRAGPLALARMVPDRAEHPSVPELEKAERWIRSFTGPMELVWGVRDPILGRALKRHREAFPQARVTELPAGHFLQEEAPVQIAEAIRRLAAAADKAERASG